MKRSNHEYLRPPARTHDAGWGLSLLNVERHPVSGPPTFTEGDRISFSGRPLVAINNVQHTGGRKTGFGEQAKCGIEYTFADGSGGVCVLTGGLR